MNAAMTLRGPDDDGAYVDERFGMALGARRLSIIDVEGGHQPVCNEDRTVWAALNGEIYNHPSLQASLQSKGHRLASRVDTEVLVHLYEEYGADMVHALEGMYAFALWDTRREELLIARDRFGEKPLFYVEHGGELHFASELDALLAGLEGGVDLDPAAVDAFFVFGYVPGPGSIARGVRQLPPGHRLRWSRGTRQLTVEPYWQPTSAPEPTAAGSFGELVAETGRLLEASVRSRLLADVPLGVFLSGGLDSTLIAALAAKVSDHPIKTFTVGYDVGEVAETDEARRTAHELGAEHHELILTQEELLRRVPQLLAGMDQPLADQALVSLHAIAEHARRDVTVAVGGEGADELFAGYPRYRWIERAERLRQALPSGAASGLAALAERAPHPRASRIADVLAPRPLLDRHVNWVTAGRMESRNELYGAALRDRIPSYRVMSDLGAKLNGSATASVMRQLMMLDQVHWLPDDVLVKADRAGMRVSLEVRTPYLHRELAEFAASVPESVHRQRGGKALLRALLDEIAPQAARKRPKTAFRVPAADWLRGPLSPLLDAQLAAGSVFSEGWFDREATRRLVTEHRAGSRDASAALWPILAFGLWLDRVRGTQAA
jgi:asparagine synthase (glutamine-hydrolysing)